MGISFALERKSGYTSPYSLGMVYPSYRRSLHYTLNGLNTSGYVAPIVMTVRGKKFRPHPELVRLPSWVARKIKRTDKQGFWKKRN